MADTCVDGRRQPRCDPSPCTHRKVQGFFSHQSVSTHAPVPASCDRLKDSDISNTVVVAAAWAKPRTPVASAQRLLPFAARVHRQTPHRRRRKRLAPPHVNRRHSSAKIACAGRRRNRHPAAPSSDATDSARTRRRLGLCRHHSPPASPQGHRAVFRLALSVPALHHTIPDPPARETLRQSKCAPLAPQIATPSPTPRRPLGVRALKLIYIGEWFGPRALTAAEPAPSSDSVYAMTE